MAYLLGDTDELSEDMQTDIKRAGISHMVAVSGFHLGIIVGTVGKIFKKLSRFAAL